VAVAVPVADDAETRDERRDAIVSPILSPVSRWVLLAVGALFLLLALTQAAGRIEFDTRLSMVMAPFDYVRSSVHLWDQALYGGTADTSVGFLFPTGLFFALTHVLAIPTWVAERIWLALLLSTAFWGVVRLTEALGIGTRWARVVAGLSYCTAPIVLTWVTTSVTLLAVVLLPWMLVPLVYGSRGGSPRRAAARSGVAVALMGGSNAAVVMAVLPLALIWFLTRKAGWRRRALVGWWLVAMVLACFWWVLATVFVGKYGYNYLTYTETSALTTSTGSVFEALRGANYWVDYFNLGGPLEPGPWVDVSTAAVVVGMAVVTGLGLAGLCRRIPERLFLISSMAFGVVVIAAGFSGASGGLFSHHVQDLLQGKLAVFRNISKFSPDVALPLAIGLAWMLSVPLWATARQNATRFIPSARAAAIGVAVVGIVAVAVAAVPYARQDLYKSGGFTAIPHYWYQAGAWLDAHQGHNNALVVPGAAFADYRWGSPTDEPLTVTANTSLEWLNIIPLGSNGYIQMLDAVEQALDSGTPTPGLAQFLAREGVNYVVERNDLNVRETGAPPPAQVHQVLSETAGLTPVASFGPTLPADQVAFGSLPVYDSPLGLLLRPVEIFRVDHPSSIVKTYPVSNPVVVSGGVGSLLTLSASSVLDGRATALSDDPLAKGVSSSPEATWAITDGNQRREVSFGGIRNNESYVVGKNQKPPDEPAGVPADYAVVPGVSHETVEAPIGAASVSASSFGSTPLVDDPDQGPSAAFDGNPNTEWVADSKNDSVGQWVSITFKRPLDLSTIAITPLVGSRTQPTVSRVTITTDRGSVSRFLPRTKSPVPLSVPQGETRSLKVTITAVRPATERAQGGIILSAGIVDIAIPGVQYQPQLETPDDEAATFSGAGRSAPVVAFGRPIQNANLSLGLDSTDDPAMARGFVLPKAMNAHITGYAVPSQSTTLEQLLEFLAPLPRQSLKVTASSWLGVLPHFRPLNLISPGREPWIAGLGDKKPVIVLSWSHPARVRSLALKLSPFASRPTEISITGPSGTPDVVRVPKSGGVVRFTPMVTDSLRIQILHSAKSVTVTPDFGVELTVPVGLAKVSVPGLRTAKVPALKTLTPITLRCGQGPTIVVDGRTVQTSVSGTLGDLLDLRPMPFAACTPQGGLPLAPGANRFAQETTVAPFQLTSAVIRQATATATARTAHGPSSRKATIRSWTNDSRSIAVTAGPATYLAVAQNYNPGWVATLGNQTLRPVRLDGWQQGYVISAGRSGTIDLHMAPQSTYLLSLLIGAAFLVLLLALVLVPARKDVPDEGTLRPLPTPWLLLAGAVAILALVSGPLALLVLPLTFVARRWGRGVMAACAFTAFVVAGVAAAWHPAALDTSGADAFGRQAQIGSVIALAAVFAALVGERLPDKWRGRNVDHDRAPAGTNQ